MNCTHVGRRCGELREPAGILSICVFSFVLEHNSKKVRAICGCHITFCVGHQYLRFSKFPIFRNILIYPNRFYVFLKCGILRNLLSIPQRKCVFFFEDYIIHKEKLL